MNGEKIVSDGFNVEQALRQTFETGYYFALNAIRREAIAKLQDEIDSLDLKLGDHTVNPINAGKSTEVRQRHERLYVAVGDPSVPVASTISSGVTDEITAYSTIFPELANWAPTEVGYQHYSSESDWISPHRDRRDDELLAVTITIGGSAIIRVFEALGDQNNYKDRANLHIIDEFQTQTGSVMMLRAPGFGSGLQVIHEVDPPKSGARDILNLRMRPNILSVPN